METDLFLVGSGAGFSGDRTDAAGPVVKSIIASGKPGAVMFETLGERTLAIGQVAKRANPNKGYEPLLEQIIRPIISDCLKNNITIVSNFGAANPMAAALLIKGIATEYGFPEAKIAVISGDDISNKININNLDIWEGDVSIAQADKLKNPQEIISANVYIGAQTIADAINAGAQVVVAGRVADPALALGPVMAHYGWRWDDWDKIAQVTLAGHLLECGAQVTGGYFADPGFKDVSDLATIGYPIAEISADASFVITKPKETGGLVNELTVKEQILYEIHDPSAYLTPDVILDISSVAIKNIDENRVQVVGAKGKPKPETLKVTVGVAGDWLGEGEISYAGPNALARSKLAIEIVRARIKLLNLKVAIRSDLIGVVSVFDNKDASMLSNLSDQNGINPDDIRVRIAFSANTESDVDRALQEIKALYCTGPAGGGGIRTSKQSRINTVSYLIPRTEVICQFDFV